MGTSEIVNQWKIIRIFIARVLRFFPSLPLENCSSESMLAFIEGQMLEARAAYHTCQRPVLLLEMLEEAEGLFLRRPALPRKLKTRYAK